MKDYFHQILKWISYNRGKVFGGILALVVVAIMFGCQITTASLTDPSREITEDQFHQEYNLLISEIDRDYLLLEKKAEKLVADYEIGAANLDKKREQRQEWVDLAGGVITTALSGNPVAWGDIVTSGGFLLVSGLLAGSVYDQRKKDKVITNLKMGRSLIGAAQV